MACVFGTYFLEHVVAFLGHLFGAAPPIPTECCPPWLNTARAALFFLIHSFCAAAASRVLHRPNTLPFLWQAVGPLAAVLSIPPDPSSVRPAARTRTSAVQNYYALHICIWGLAFTARLWTSE
jgi:hypothetical protein